MIQENLGAIPWILKNAGNIVTFQCVKHMDKYKRSEIKAKAKYSLMTDSEQVP